MNPAYDQPTSGKYYAVSFIPIGEFISRSAWDQVLDIPDLAPGENRKLFIDGKLGEPLLMWSGGFSNQGYEFTITVAEDISPIQERLQVFQWYFAAVSLLLMVAANARILETSGVAVP